MSDAPLPAALLEWAARTGGAAVDRSSIDVVTGGSVSPLVEQITLHVAGRALTVVRKRALPHEIAGLRAAQVVRPAATAIPELIAWGGDDPAGGPWMITARAAGEPMRGWGAPIPASLWQSLARLHAHHHGRTAGLDPIIPRVDAAWWRELCRSWVLPRIGDNPRAAALIAAAADHPAARATLERLTPTLLHGDVHPGNVIVDGDGAGLIDWGSARIGPPMLDLANLVRRDSEAFTTYAQTWREITGQSLDANQAALGYRWADVQLPIQYLPWTTQHLPVPRVEAALDKIEEALAALAAPPE